MLKYYKTLEEIHIKVVNLLLILSISGVLITCMIGSPIQTKGKIVNRNILLICGSRTSNFSSKQEAINNALEKDNVIKNTADRVVITKFTIENSEDFFPKMGINISSNNNTIKDNIFSNNKIVIEKYFEIPIFLMLLIIIGSSVLTIIIFYLDQKRQKNKIPNLDKSTHYLDTKGEICPIPLIMTKKKIKKIKKGEILEIITDDIVAKENIQRYAEEKHILDIIKEKEEIYKIYIKKR